MISKYHILSLRTRNINELAFMELVSQETVISSLVNYFTSPPLSLTETDPLFDAIRRDATIVKVKKDVQLCKVGERARHFWWLSSGEVEAWIPDDEGVLIRVGVITPGNLLGESALYRGDEAFRNSTLVAGKDSLLLQILVHGRLTKALLRSGIFDYFETLRQSRLREQYTRILIQEGSKLCGDAGYTPTVVSRDEIVSMSNRPQFIFILSGEFTMVREEGEVLEVLEIVDANSDAGLWNALHNERPDFSLVANSDGNILIVPVDAFHAIIEQSSHANRLRTAVRHLRNLTQLKPRIRRSFNPFAWKTLLFLPQFAFEKAWQVDADAFIVDFQDAVPLPVKAAAREGLKSALHSGELGDRPIIVRINENAIADEKQLDLDAVVGLQGVTALMPTMTEHPDELDSLHEELSRRETALGIPVGSTKLLPLIETPAAVLRIDAIAQAGGGRMIGVFLGHGDLFRLSGATPHANTTMDYPRNAVLFAARAAGIAAFDTPYTKVMDIVGLERESREAKRHGFDGKACIHRDQISIVRRCMMPSSDEITWAAKVEEARKSGLLDTLAKKLNARGISDKSNRQTDGMALVDGQLVGPPHIKAAQRILNLTGSWELPAVGRPGKIVQHRSDADIVPGGVIDNPYEMTITEGMLDLWMQSFYTHNPADTSSVYASMLGRCSQGRMPIPFMMVLYLCVSMSDTHGAIYHLGFRNARQIRPIQTGDTVRQKITMISVRNTQDGRRSVVTTLRELIDVNSGEVVFRTNKLEMYANQPADFGALEPVVRSDDEQTHSDPLLSASVAGWKNTHALRANWDGYGFSKLSVAPGDILLHSFTRPLGITANLALSTRFCVTHPIHLDHKRFDQGDGLGVVVSGGLVISLILGAAARDFNDTLWEELVGANNVKTLSPGETVGAFSVILEKKQLGNNPGIEQLLVKTIGVKNLTPTIDMEGMIIPDTLLEPLVGGGSSYDELCRAAQLPALEGKIIGEVLRKIVRPAGKG